LRLYSNFTISIPQRHPPAAPRRAASGGDNPRPPSTMREFLWTPLPALTLLLVTLLCAAVPLPAHTPEGERAGALRLP
jgi:hypothetical protein